VFDVDDPRLDDIARLAGELEAARNVLRNRG
jgi:hypothetical protein